MVKVETKTIEVKIPAGVDNGNQLRIPGKGEAALMADQMVMFI